jgi:DNA-directed RNA polymerase subunit RPC12/RpoP
VSDSAFRAYARARRLQQTGVQAGEICNRCDHRIFVDELWRNRCSSCGNVLSEDGATRPDPDYMLPLTPEPAANDCGF